MLLCACACGREALAPVDVTSADACAFCRMAVSDPRVAAQIVADGEEPRFFDDIGCLAKWLNENRAPDAAVAFVADHRNGRWTPARTALYSKVPHRATPMGSNILAHADLGSRNQDDAARTGEPLGLDQVFGGATVPGEGNHAR